MLFTLYLLTYARETIISWVNIAVAGVLGKYDML
jgi:hypothetical protein